MGTKFIILKAAGVDCLVNVAHIRKIDFQTNDDMVEIHIGEMEPIRLEKGDWNSLYEAHIKALIDG